MSECKVLYATTSIFHPFTAGRVEMMKSEGIEVETVGYVRGNPSGRVLPTSRFTVLGSIRSQAYYRRVPLMLRHVFGLRRAIRRNDVVVVNGGDLTLIVHLAVLLLDRPVVRDVPDIEKILVQEGLTSRFFRKLDKLIEGRCKMLILTSAAAETYYRDWLRVDTPVLVVENKVERKVADVWQNSFANGARAQVRSTPLADRPLRVGWFAQIRDQWSLDFVEHLSRKFGDRFQVVIAGFVGLSIRGFDEFLERNPAIEYLGPFRQIEDLPQLYSRVDMSLATVLPELPTSLALSCRYFTSCMLGTPLIVRAGTYAGDRVRQNEAGMVLQSLEPDDAAAELAAISASDWLDWQAAVAALPPEEYIYSHEGRELAKSLRELAGS